MASDEQELNKIRYERLKLVSKKALEQTIKKSLAIKQISECYPNISSSEEGLRSLQIARAQIIDFWYRTSMREFDVIFKERDIERKLDELDEIIDSAQARKREGREDPIEMDRLDPERLIESSVFGSKKATYESLKMIYCQLQKDNVELYQQFDKLYEESNSAHEQTRAMVEQLKKNSESVNDESFSVRIEDLVDKITE